jgi:ribonuclease J
MKIHTIGGYSEVGKNMTALEVGEDVILFDMGIFLPAIIGVEEREKIPTENGMRALGALADDLYLDRHHLRDKVRAIIISHAHLDHVGAIPYQANRYNAEILGTPFTMEFLKILLKDNNHRINNKIVSIQPNGSYIIKGKVNYKVEFINVTHSTIHAAMIAVHTPEGVVIYANDYKLDNSPVFGELTNYKRLKELSKIGVKALIVDSLYAPDDRKTPSEKIAKGLLEDVLFTTHNENSGIIVSTFSSHISRLKTITELGKKLNREVVFVGRSLSKYMEAADRAGMAPFKDKIKIATYKNQKEKMLERINNNKKHFLVVCTGHQGEPGSILDRMSKGQLPLKIGHDDHVIFSSRTIPSPVNELAKEQLVKRLKKLGARIFDSIHVSGHGGREDLRDLIKLVNPEHVIPSHGDLKKLTAGADLAQEMGYTLNKTVHLMKDGDSLEIK